MHIETNDDYFEKGEPIHRISYCAFMDVLGFSAQISESFDNNRGDELLRKFHAILSERISEMKKEQDETLLYFKSFTDNVILAHPRFSQDLESEFGFILDSILEFQFRMALAGFFIRGGLSIGPLFIDENSVYGPALLEAYALESKKAVNPVVVLSDDVMGLVLNHLEFYASIEIAPQNRHVWINDEGRFFLNYLTECVWETDGGDEIDWESLKKHKKLIERHLDRYRSMPSVFGKYVWLASYHNEFCKSVSSFPGYTPAVRVRSRKFKFKFRRLSEISL